MEAAVLESVITLDSKSFERGMDRSFAQLVKMEAAINRTGGNRKLEDSFERQALKASVLGGTVGVLVGTITSGLVSGMVAGARATLDYTARLEQLQVGFSTLIGSVDLARKHLQDLENFAAATPFRFLEVANASRRFQAVGVAAGEVLPILKDVGNAVAALGGGSVEINRVSLAISQIIAKGKVSAEEINQLAEVGIGGWKILSEQLGVTKGEVMKLSEQGRISSEMFIAAFQRYSQLKFGDAMEKQSKTFNGAMSTIQDTLQMTASRAFEPLFKKISLISVKLAEELQKTKTFEQALTRTLRSLGGAAGAVAGELGRSIVDGITGEISSSGSKSKVSAALQNLMGFGGDFYEEFMKGMGVQKPILNLPSITGGQSLDIFGRPVDLKTGRLVIAPGKKWSENKPEGETANPWDVTRTTPPVTIRQPTMADLLPGRAGARTPKQTDEQRRVENLTEAIAALRREVQFYGDDSEVASTKQQLMSMGFKNMDGAGQQLAITLAAQLDTMRANTKSSDDFKASQKAVIGLLNEEALALREVIAPMSEYERMLKRMTEDDVRGALTDVDKLGLRMSALRRDVAANVSEGMNGDPVFGRAFEEKMNGAIEKVKELTVAVSTPPVDLMADWEDASKRMGETISDGLFAGVRGFMDGGWRGFLRDMVDSLSYTVMNEMRQVVEDGLSTMFQAQGAASGQGAPKRGILGTLLGMGIKAIGSAFGGGGNPSLPVANPTMTVLPPLFRAAGGPAFSPFMAGEAGPELVVPYAGGGAYTSKNGGGRAMGGVQIGPFNISAPTPQAGREASSQVATQVGRELDHFYKRNS
ncbi:MAG: tape measure protein [Pyrinomonadaceae bacterium]